MKTLKSFAMLCTTLLLCNSCLKGIGWEEEQRENNKEPEKPEEAVDYKKLYEQSQEDLKKAQAANIKKDAAPAQAPDPMNNLKDLVSSFL